MAFSGDPTGEAEEAPSTPRGKRSLLRKSTAAFNRAFIKSHVLRIPTFLGRYDMIMTKALTRVE